MSEDAVGERDLAPVVHGALSDAVLRLLPLSYVVALQCVADGDDDDVIAERVGVDPAAVPALVRLATAKLLDVQARLAVENA